MAIFHKGPVKLVEWVKIPFLSLHVPVYDFKLV